MESILNLHSLTTIHLKYDDNCRIFLECLKTKYKKCEDAGQKCNLKHLHIHFGEYFSIDQAQTVLEKFSLNPDVLFSFSIMRFFPFGSYLEIADIFKKMEFITELLKRKDIVQLSFPYYECFFRPDTRIFGMTQPENLTVGGRDLKLALKNYFDGLKDKHVIQTDNYINIHQKK